MPVDRRGYDGSEKNRQIAPSDVLWAREEYFAGRVTPRALSRQFGMGIESVRRMLRGDTYANVGEALPRVAEIASTQAIDDGGAFERLIGKAPAASEPTAVQPSFDEPATIEPDEGEEAVLAFLRSEEAKRS